jgi:hypothetical protein
MIEATIGLASGHDLLSDWLLLIAAVFFLVDGLLRFSGRPDPTRGALVPYGLCLVAVALLLL